MKLYTLGKTSGFWNLHTLCVCANIPRLIFPSSTAEKTVTEDGGEKNRGGIGGVINIYLPALGICAILRGFAESYRGVRMIYTDSLGRRICPLSPRVIFYD